MTNSDSEIQQVLSELRKEREKHIGQNPPNRPVAVWKEKDGLLMPDGEGQQYVNHGVADVLVVILRTKGCSWAWKSGCTMCGYINDASPHATGEKLVEQMKMALSKHGGEPFVKIFTSGSFFDPSEVGEKERAEIIRLLREKGIKKVSVESRPEYIDDETLEKTKKILGDMYMEVGVGLETSSDAIRQRSINKGFTFSRYTVAMEKLRLHGFGRKTYLLLKPPFLTERQGMDDLSRSIRDVAGHTDVISINPMNIQKYTLVEHLWKKGQYRAPWLWSLIEAIREALREPPGAAEEGDHPPYIVSYPSGGGTERGIHNCGKCDRHLLSKLREYSLTQSARVLAEMENAMCRCRKTWQNQLETDELYNAHTDIESWKKSGK